jgi:tetratricopeptide (TPR) repeat protein
MDTVTKILSLLDNGHQEEALKQCQQIIKSGTDDEKYDLAEELTQLGFLEEAAALFQNLIEKYPDEGELFISLAEIFIEMGQEEEAMLLLEKIKQEDECYPQSLLLIADLYQMNGLYEVSESKLLKAKTLLPNEIVIDFALGELYGELGKFQEAIDAYKIVLEKGTKELAGVSIYHRLAEMLSASGLFEDAISYYELALKEKLEINLLFGYALTAFQAGMNKTAIEKFEELKELDPEYHSLYLYLAKAYEKEEEIAKSFETIIAGISYDEFNKDLFYYGGKLALKLGNEQEAERLLREAIAVDPGFTEAVLVLNKLLLRQERYDDVLELIKHVEYYEEEEPQLLWDEAIAYQNLEQYSQALNKYNAAYTLFKNNEEFLSDYGYFLMGEGKRAEAVEIFSELLKNDPSNEEYQELIDRLQDQDVGF